MKFKQNVDERRDAIRMDFKIPVEIFCSKTGLLLKGMLVNLSIHGLLVEFPKDSAPVVVDKQGICIARLTFQGKSSKLMIDELQFTISRFGDGMLALEFIEPLEWFLLFTVYKNKQIRN